MGPNTIYLIRHGETPWTLSGQHTGVTDIPLTKKGEEDAARVGQRLSLHTFNLVICSPLQRAMATCQKAGLLSQASTDPLLKEWDYGTYEGMTTEQIWEKDPKWNLFSHGAPGGESVEEIGLRADRVIKKIYLTKGNVALFSHGHFLRVLTARFLTLPVEKGRLFALSPASLSTLGFERGSPVITLWNSI